MLSQTNRWLGVLLITLCLASSAHAARLLTTLWQIGAEDRDNAEFALAPSHYDQFTEDAFYRIGVSQPQTDWPYVQPGPNDAWAGSRPHTFTIVFGLNNILEDGPWTLRVHLLDTQRQAPPRLKIQVNGQPFEQRLPAGASDASIFGDPRQGSPFSFAIDIPPAALQVGDNVLTLTTVSGCWLLYDSLSLDAPAEVRLAPVKGSTFLEGSQAIRALQEKEGQWYQPLRLTLRHEGEPVEAQVRVPGMDPQPIQLQPGRHEIATLTPAVTEETTLEVALLVADQPVALQRVTVRPVQKKTVFLVPHSHTDIGYTDLQTTIEEKQVNNLLTGIQYARETADYPEGARFIWNVEVLWAADLYLNRLSKEQQDEFIAAVQKGWVSLNGMYLNELTGLCRPEELLHLFRYAAHLQERTGVPIDSAMISDVPGYTWGTVTAMAQAGIQYFSTAPNYFDRIGDILQQWENKPFYWISPSGKEKVLVWIPLKGYALSHVINKLSDSFVEDFQTQLDEMDYPYDIAYLRWSGHGDNAVPDKTICEFVKDWNTTYAYPKFIIASNSDAFRAFEARYSHQLPHVRGDWTPYWEDGAGSSALETAMNRASSDRLSQAQTLFAMMEPWAYPRRDIEEAWKQVLLYSEHTWGAWCSVSDPENQMTQEQWEIKRGYALQAHEQTERIFESALALRPGDDIEGIDVINTTSWPRTELVMIPKARSMAGDAVTDAQGNPVPSQRLQDGTLAIIAQDIPPFAARRYVVRAGEAFVQDQVAIEANGLDNGIIRILLDEQTGGIKELAARGIEGNFADPASGYTLNQYLFLPGDNLADVQSTSAVKITVKEPGPLVASYVVESQAPGCNALTTEYRLWAGADYVEMVNCVDKKRGPQTPTPGDWVFAQKGGKESVNFAFPFQVPDGVMRLDIPLGMMQPERDQIPSACKNWFTVGRWADVSNEQKGVTWVTLDAPLLQVGELSARLLGSQSNPDIWRKTVDPTQTLFSWVMNNHWGTNYRAYQEGPVLFRYALRPHDGFDSGAAARFATGLSHNLIAAPAVGAVPAVPRLQVTPTDAMVIAFKPSEDGKAWIVRLFGAAEEDTEATLQWSDPAPHALYLSDTSEKARQKQHGPVIVPAWDVVTLRAEFAR